jgi:hypothetical protein
MVGKHGGKIVLAGLVGLAILAPSASARFYGVWSCRDGTGRATPVSDAAGGWAPIGYAPGRSVDDLCDSSSPRLSAAIGGTSSVPVGAAAGWRFTAPPNTYIYAYSIVFSGYTRPFNGQNQGSLEVWGSDSGRSLRLEGVGDVAQMVAGRTEIHDHWAEAFIACDGAPGAADCQANQTHATLAISQTQVAIGDDSPPVAGTASGSAVASDSWEGTEVFALPVTDSGGGVYQAILLVDGVPVATRTIDAWDGRCVDASDGGRYFRFPRPCPTSVDALVPVDTTQLPAGTHNVTLQVADPAWNLATVYSARKTIVVPARRIGPGSDLAERGAANGENAADDARLTARWVRRRGATLTAPYGRRNVIRGRLTTAGGAGIRNARIEMRSAIDGRAGPPLDKGGARTRSDGRFTVILPGNTSSRTLLLRYRSHVNDTVSIAEATLRVKVRAGVRLRVAPHTAARGRAVRLSGRLVGRPLPTTGKVVELQARSPGERWITFRTVRASRRGRFAIRYTFRRGGPVLYLMRARVRAADDYPYATGVSHAARVLVR